MRLSSRLDSLHLLKDYIVFGLNGLYIRILKDYTVLSSLMLKSHSYILENLHLLLYLFIFVFSPTLFFLFQVFLRVYNPSRKQDCMMVATRGIPSTGKKNNIN